MFAALVMAIVFFPVYVTVCDLSLPRSAALALFVEEQFAPSR